MIDPYPFRVFFSIMLGFIAGGALAEENPDAIREWTNRNGKMIRGSMMGTQDENVVLKLESGKKATVPIKQLSEKDRAFVAKHGLPALSEWNGWPDDIRMEISKVDVRVEPRGDGWTIYHTKHFEIHSVEELAQSVHRDVARTFELTYQLLSASPWGIIASPMGGKFRAELYKTREDYIAAGGPENSLGVYFSSRKVFIVPFTTLGLEHSNRGWQRTKTYDTATLAHELTHMMMDDALQAMPMWLIEGSAVYIQEMPVLIGSFSPKNHLKEFRNRNEKAYSSALIDVFRMSHKLWNSSGDAHSSKNTRTPTFYQAGALWTYYFIHLDGKGDAGRLRKYIRSCLRDARKLAEFQEMHEAYRKEMEKFMQLPGVEDLGEGKFRYPSELTPPKAPSFPFNCEPDDVHERNLEILLDGRSLPELEKEALAALAKVKLNPRLMTHR